MAYDLNHIVHQLKWDIVTDSFTRATDAQRTIGDLKSELNACIEESFDAFCQSGRSLRLDKLEIELGSLKDIKVDKLKYLLKEKLREALSKKSDVNYKMYLPNGETQNGVIHSNEKADTLPEEHFDKKQSFDLFIYCLENGHWPWWHQTHKPFRLNDFFEQSITHFSPVEKKRFLSTLQNQVVRKRLWQQLSVANKSLLIDFLFSENQSGSIPLLTDVIEEVKDLGRPDLAQTEETNSPEIQLGVQVYFNQLLKDFLKQSFPADFSIQRLLEELDWIVWNQSVSSMMAMDGQFQLLHLDSVYRDLVHHLLTEYSHHYISEMLPKWMFRSEAFVGEFQKYIQSKNLKEFKKRPFELDLNVSQIEKIIRNLTNQLDTFTSATSLDTCMEESKMRKKSSKTKKQNASVSESGIIPCVHAGLVLLWPYLNGFFKKLEWLENKQFISPWHQSKAIMLLHFLATESQEAHEHELTIGKLLCGVNPKEYIPTSFNFEAHEVEACEELLAAVITNWTALKSTSVDGLRTAFLKRGGFLEMRNGKPVLKIERQTIDVLIDRLGYGLNMVVLPWRKEILTCEW